MIVDTSAVSAIFFGEPEGGHYTQMVHDADRCRISAANFVVQWNGFQQDRHS
jgi:ribonuclease VapC